MFRFYQESYLYKMVRIFYVSEETEMTNLQIFEDTPKEVFSYKVGCGWDRLRIVSLSL